MSEISWTSHRQRHRRRGHAHQDRLRGMERRRARRPRRSRRGTASSSSPPARRTRLAPAALPTRSRATTRPRSISRSSSSRTPSPGLRVGHAARDLRHLCFWRSLPGGGPIRTSRLPQERRRLLLEHAGAALSADCRDVARHGRVGRYAKSGSAGSSGRTNSVVSVWGYSLLDPSAYRSGATRARYDCRTDFRRRRRRVHRSPTRPPIRALGFSNGDADRTLNDIDFAFWRPTESVFVDAEGLPDGRTTGAPAVGDRLRVAVEGGVVKYRRNGTLFIRARRRSSTRCSSIRRFSTRAPWR